MNATQKNMTVMIVFFTVILGMAIYYSTVLQKKLQAPLSYVETDRPMNAGQFANLN